MNYSKTLLTNEVNDDQMTLLVTKGFIVRLVGRNSILNLILTKLLVDLVYNPPNVTISLKKMNYSKTLLTNKVNDDQMTLLVTKGLIVRLVGLNSILNLISTKLLVDLVYNHPNVTISLKKMNYSKTLLTNEVNDAQTTLLVTKGLIVRPVGRNSILNLIKTKLLVDLVYNHPNVTISLKKKNYIKTLHTNEINDDQMTLLVTKGLIVRLVGRNSILNLILTKLLVDLVYNHPNVTISLKKMNYIKTLLTNEVNDDQMTLLVTKGLIVRLVGRNSILNLI